MIGASSANRGGVLQRRAKVGRHGRNTGASDESPVDRSPAAAEARPDPPAQPSDGEDLLAPGLGLSLSRPVRRWALVVLGICALLFVYHLFADRLTPFTTQASVNAFVVPVSPEVAGLVTEVNVVDNQKVEAGEVLVRVDAERYRLPSPRRKRHSPNPDRTCVRRQRT